MPIRSGAMQRPGDCRCGNTLRQRYDDVGLPCRNTMGSPCPTSTNAISRSRTRRRCFWYGRVAEMGAVRGVYDEDRSRCGNSRSCFVKVGLPAAGRHTSIRPKLLNVDGFVIESARSIASLFVKRRKLR